MIPCAHTVAQVCALLVSSSSPCLMRTIEWLSLRPLHLPHFLSLSSSPLASCTSFCLSPSSSLMSWTKTTRTAAEELGPADNKNSSTGIEPNDHFITEAYVEFTQESVAKQRFPEDLDYDDITIGQTLLNACRRRAFFSEGEGLLSCLSSSSMSHDRTGTPVVCRDASHAQGHEIQRQNSESEQIRTLLDRQREQILADCQAEIKKTRIPGWLWPKKYTEIKWNDRVAARRTSSCSSRRTTSTRSSTSSWTGIEAKLGSSWTSWEKPQWNGRIEEISGFYIRHDCKKKIGRRSRYYPWTHWQDTGIAKWK